MDVNKVVVLGRIAYFTSFDNDSLNISLQLLFDLLLDSIDSSSLAFLFLLNFKNFFLFCLNNLVVLKLDDFKQAARVVFADFADAFFNDLMWVLVIQLVLHNEHIDFAV